MNAPILDGTLRARFDDKWMPVPEAGCWLWLGTTTKCGPRRVPDIRPRFNIEKRRHFAHRVSWELHRGPIPDGLCVCHKCDTPLCVNPDHLFLGGVRENNLDREAKGRSRVPFGEDHPRSKLTQQQVKEIRALAASGAPYNEIAPLFGVNAENVSFIARRITWKHVA